MKILVIKTGALGDVVRTSFLAQALKDKYQKKLPEIFWITDPEAKPLFINNPYVTKIITFEEKNILKSMEFDIIINLEENKEICRFASSLKSKKTLGFLWGDNKIIPSKSAKEWFDMSLLGEKPKNDILKKKNKKSHRQIMAELAEIKNFEKYEPFLRLTENQRKLAEDFLRRYNLSRTDPIIGINTGSGDRWPKQLSIKKTCNLIDSLSEKFGAKILLFGGINEAERNKQIISYSKSHIIDTGCGNNLIEFPSIISVCKLFITSDSLGLHISLALKRKTICLVGPTSSTEIDEYELGEKIIAKSSCICCYKEDCKSMDKIDIKEILKSVERLLKEKVSFLITAFKEPNIGKSIEAALNQETDYKYKIIISAPDDATLNIAKKYQEANKNVKTVKDPGKGKSYALNIIFNSINTDILILSDGDVYVNNKTINEIVNLFQDPEIGCVTGRPVPTEDKSTKYGYWANFLFESAHKMRKNAFQKNAFLECSGYLFAFRKNIIKKIPLDVAEDSIIPYYFWERGYKIGYAEKAEVYVKNPDNWKDWIKQKTRTSKAHETLSKYVDTSITPRAKTFKNESKGIFGVLRYPENIVEFFWTLELILARLYMWTKVIIDTKMKKKHYKDAWERSESTK